MDLLTEKLVRKIQIEKNDEEFSLQCGDNDVHNVRVRSLFGVWTELVRVGGKACRERM
jgi:hypothetical protein